MNAQFGQWHMDIDEPGHQQNHHQKRIQCEKLNTASTKKLKILPKPE
jgi:hypothetical protein